MKQHNSVNSVARWGLVLMFGVAIGLVGCDDQAGGGGSEIAPTSAMDQRPEPAATDDPATEAASESASESAPKSADAAPKPTKTVALKVEGMHCDGCANALKTNLATMPGVVMADVSFARGEAKVGVSEDGPTPQDLVAQVIKANSSYTAELIDEQPAEPSGSSSPATEADGS